MVSFWFFDVCFVGTSISRYSPSTGFVSAVASISIPVVIFVSVLTVVGEVGFKFSVREPLWPKLIVSEKDVALVPDDAPEADALTDGIPDIRVVIIMAIMHSMDTALLLIAFIIPPYKYTYLKLHIHQNVQRSF